MIKIMEEKHCFEDFQIPQNLKCPITKYIMKDPVIAFDTYTYERTAFEEWINRNEISPVTGEK